MSDLPPGWAEASFSELAEVRLGKMLDKAKNRGEPTRYLRNVNVRWGGFDLSDLLEMRFTDEERIYFRILDGDVLVCEGGEPGRAAVWRGGDTDVVYQKALERVRSAGGVAPEWLALRLKQLAEAGALEEHFTGSTIKHLPAVALGRVSVPVPPLAEQRRIVAKIDALIARSKRVRAELTRVGELARAARDAVLEDCCGSAGEARMKWPRRTVGDVSAATFDGPFGSSLKSIDYTHAGARVVRLENIGHLTFFEEKRTYIPDAKAATLIRHKLHAGDVMFSSFVDDAIRVCVLPDLPGVTINKADCFCVRADPARCLPAYLAFRLACASNYEALSAAVHGATRPRINLTQLKAVSFGVPTLPEQRAIVARIEAAFARIDAVVAEAERAAALLDRLDQAVLAKAFRGELVPQDPADEPASALLARLAADRPAAVKRRGRRVSA